MFLDEIHRFTKAQQDALLPGVEDGIIILVGATTENPFFEVNSPLISRSSGVKSFSGYVASGSYPLIASTTNPAMAVGNPTRTSAAPL